LAYPPIVNRLASDFLLSTMRFSEIGREPTLPDAHRCCTNKTTPPRMSAFGGIADMDQRGDDVAF
jgi:hypothetical protein